MDTISIHEVSVVRALADGAWRTSKEIAQLAEVADRTARHHCLRLSNLGVLDQAQVFPGHRYRLSGEAGQREGAYMKRLKAAAVALNMEIKF